MTNCLSSLDYLSALHAVCIAFTPKTKVEFVCPAALFPPVFTPLRLYTPSNLRPPEANKIVETSELNFEEVR